MLHSRQRTTRTKLIHEKQFTRMQTMKKVKVSWTEFHYYEAEIEIPDNLSHEEEIDWVMNNTDDWGKSPEFGWREPYEINTDWDSFEIDEVDE
jgi:hypothetical protein